METDVYDITLKYLKENGFDGLYQRGECACTIDDLMPCDDMRHDCVAGYKSQCKGCNNEAECPHGFDKDSYDWCIQDNIKKITPHTPMEVRDESKNMGK